MSGEKGEPDVETKVLRMRGEFILLYVVKLLFGDAVDAIENLLIYSTKPAILETNEKREFTSGRDYITRKCP